MIEKRIITTKATKEERIFRVYLPKGYEKEGKHYRVLYMHDGQNVFNDQEAIGGVSLQLEDYLEKSGLELIVVAIDQLSEKRQDEYCPWKNGEYSKRIAGEVSPRGGEGKKYINFLLHDLKPLIDKDYRTIPEDNLMVGISLGALITVYAGSLYPHLFKRIAGLSAAFFRNQEEIEKHLEQADLSQVERLYLDCGTNESKEEEISKEFLLSNQRVYHIIRNKTQESIFREVEDGEHSYTAFKNRLPSVLNYLLG